MNLDTVIHNAVVINAHGRFEGWVGTAGEKVVACSADADPPSAGEVIDAGGKVAGAGGRRRPLPLGLARLAA